MKYILQNDKWEVTYVDSANIEQVFYHPTQIKNLPKYIEEGVTELLIIDEEKIKEIFSSDSITENIVNSTTLLTESEQWLENAVSENATTPITSLNASGDLTNHFITQLDNQQITIDKLNERISILELLLNQK